MEIQDDQNDIGGTRRATQRPAHVHPPSDWMSTPVPEPQPISQDAPENQPGGRDPVRYGDWELKGIAIDF